MRCTVVHTCLAYGQWQGSILVYVFLVAFRMRVGRALVGFILLNTCLVYRQGASGVCSADFVIGVNAGVPVRCTLLRACWVYSQSTCRLCSAESLASIPVGGVIEVYFAECLLVVCQVWGALLGFFP